MYCYTNDKSQYPATQVHELLLHALARHLCAGSISGVADAVCDWVQNFRLDVTDKSYQLTIGLLRRILYSSNFWFCRLFPLADISETHHHVKNTW